MKKTLIALAALAATGAFAQSSVSVYGAVDAALAQYTSEGVTKTGLYNSQLGSSKLGFMGKEDLGGGLFANFKLEGGLANDFGGGKASNSSNQTGGASGGGSGNGGAGPFTSLNGAQGLVFQRYSYVGLSGGFGEIRLGRDYHDAFWYGVATVDPFGTNGPADSSVMTLNLAARNSAANASGISNAIGYWTPTMSGFTAGVQVSFGENRSTNANKDDGNGVSAFVNYTSGPILISAGTLNVKGTVQNPVNAALGATATSSGLASNTGLPGANGDYNQTGISAAYDFGVAKVVYTYAHEDLLNWTTAGTKNTNDSNLIGVIVPMGAMNLKASYIASAYNSGATGAADNKGTLFGLGFDYALSKRTKLYGTYSAVTNDNGNQYSAGGAGFSSAGGANLTSANNPSSSGFALGVFHAF